jgi:hypothetical protein
MLDNALFAISYMYIPELIELRERYERYWCVVAAVAIVGWAASYVCFRLWTKPRTFGVLNPRYAVISSILVGVSTLAGFCLGWAIWTSNFLWSWGDFGAGSRWQAEFAICAIGGTGWGTIVGQILVLVSLRFFPCKVKQSVTGVAIGEASNHWKLPPQP